MKLSNLIGLVAAASVVQGVMAAGGERDVSLAGPGWRFAKGPTCESLFPIFSRTFTLSALRQQRDLCYTYSHNALIVFL